MVVVMENVQPTVSLVVPTMDAGRFLRDCLLSIANQTFQDFEIVIVDGGSTDQTLSIAAEFQKVRVVSQQSKGLPGAWNEGVEHAVGSFVGFLDSDDILQPNALAAHLEQFANAPETMASIGMVSFFLDDPATIPIGFQPHLLNDPHVAYMPGCFLGRKEIFNRLGLFETRWVILSDIVWFDRLKSQSDLVTICNQVVLRKRVHGSNLSYTTASETPIYKRELLQYMREKVKGAKSKETPLMNEGGDRGYE